MKSFLPLIFVTLLLGCKSDDGITSENSDLIGKWQLIEQLVDPGDGSGTFQPVESNRTIEFFANGTVEINGELCFTSVEIGETERGTYTLISDATTDIAHDGEISPNKCQMNFSNKVNFDITMENHLILWYACIEGCGQKFAKVN